MADGVLETEGSIEIKVSKHGIEAVATMYFVFDGDWSNMYDDQPDSEEEARAWFVEEVERVFEGKRSEAREGKQAERPSDDENRGA